MRACLHIREVLARWSCPRRYCNVLGAVVDEVGRKLAVHGAGAGGEDPGRDVGDGAQAGARVAGGADNGDAAADGVEGPDGDAVVEVVAGLAAEGERQNVHAIVDGGVERGQDVRVEALAAVHGRVAHAVRRHARARRAADRRAFAESEHGRAGRRRAGGRGQRVRAVAVDVARRVVRGVEGAHCRGVALVEVTRADQLPAHGRSTMSGERTNYLLAHRAC
jgi:hypothetical protein